MTASYWANGATQQLTIPGVPTITYGVDSEGRAQTVSASQGQNPVTATTYNVSSLPTAVTLGSSDSDSFSYDANTNRPTQYAFSINGQSVVGNLTWNSNGSLQNLNITDPFNPADQQTCNYSADDLGRLSSVSCGSTWSQTFTYDVFGNISKSGSISWAASYNPTNNHVTTVGSSAPTYDANGNLTNDTAHNYNWNSEGSATTIDSVTLTYDAMGRMVEQNRSGAYTQILYGPDGSKLALFNGQTLSKAFVGLPAGATAVFNASGLNYYRHTDWLGSSRFASTTARAEYYDGAYAPLGESYSESGTADRSFTGHNQDTVPGLNDFLYRENSPTQGRWLSPDPASTAVFNLTNPQSLNRYAYLSNNPLVAFDPLGLGPCDGMNLGAQIGGGMVCNMPPDYPYGLPAWLFDCSHSASIAFQAGICGGWSPSSGTCPPWANCARGGQSGGGGPAQSSTKPDANGGKSICSNASGKTIPVNTPFGQMRFQFNGSGNLIGLGLQLTGMNTFSGSGLSIPPNTFAGFSQLSPGTVQFGFSNPVNVGSGFSQAYFQTATFSGGRFTSVQGAYAPLGIPLGSSSGNSSLMQRFLNGNSSTASQAQNFGNLLTSVASLVSSNVTCRDMFGGG